MYEHEGVFCLFVILFRQTATYIIFFELWKGKLE